MLFGLEGVVAFLAGLVMLDIAAGIFAVRHVVEQQVGDLRQLLVELVAEFFLLRFQRRQRDFKLVYFGHQLKRCVLVLFLLGLADLLGRRIAPRLCQLVFGDRRPPLLVERHQSTR